MKIACVAQPWDVVDPNSLHSSIPIIVYELARRLSQSNEVVIYSKKGKNQPSSEKLENGILMRRIDVDTEQRLLRAKSEAYRLFGSRKQNRPFYGSSWYYPGYFSKVAKDLRHQGCDLVHIINFSQLVPVVRRHNPDIKIVLHMECEWLSQLDGDMIRPWLEKADAILGCSHFITDRVRQKFPALADRCKTLHNGVDPDKFSSLEDGAVAQEARIKRLLYIGRPSPEKGLHILLDAFKIVAERHPDLCVDIVGGGGLAPLEYTILVSDDKLTRDLISFYETGDKSDGGRYLSSLKEQVPPTLADNVKFHGNVEQSKLADFFSRASAFVFPSVWHEPFGIPLVEAMACQVPVVATRSGGMPEIVKDGETGFIVERGDPQSLADAVEKIVSQDELRVSMGQKGRQRVLELFSWDVLAAELGQMYETIVGDSHA